MPQELVPGSFRRPTAYWISPLIRDTIGRGLDMTAPALIFGGLLAAAIAFCGNLDASPTFSDLNFDAQVLSDESVIGENPNDPVTSCGRERSQLGQRCRGKSGIIRASVIH